MVALDLGHFHFQQKMSLHKLTVEEGTSMTCSPLFSVSLQWINSRTLVLVDSHEKLHVVDRPSQEVLETLDLEQVQLVYNSRHFKSLATGGNVSQALVRGKSGWGTGSEVKLKINAL